VRPIGGLKLSASHIHEARTDDRRRQFQQRFVDVQPSFKADSQIAQACKPSVRPLHHPSVLAQPLAGLNASSGNTPLSQMRTATLVVIALVGVQLGWSFAGMRWQACNRRNRVHAPLEHLVVVPVRAADQDRQRDASGIYNDVSLGAELALSNDRPQYSPQPLQEAPQVSPPQP